MTQADSVHSTPPTNTSAIDLHERLKAAGMRLQRVANNQYSILWRNQTVCDRLSLLGAARFIDRALRR